MLKHFDRLRKKYSLKNAKHFVLKNLFSPPPRWRTQALEQWFLAGGMLPQGSAI